MIKQRFFVKAISMALVFAVCIYGFSANAEYLIKPQAAKSVSDLQKQQQELQKKSNDLQKKINSANSSIKNNTEKQALLTDKIDTLNQKIDVQTQLLNQLNTQVAELDVSITNQQADLDQGIADFKARLRAMYMAGDGETAEVLAGSTDFYDLLTRMEVMKRISKHDNDMVIDLTDKLEQLNIDRTTAQGLRDDAQATKNSMDADMSTLQTDFDSTDAQIARAKAEAAEYAKNKKKIDAEEKKIEEELIAAIRAAQQSNQYVGGEFIWPVPGYYSLSSTYGNRNLFGTTAFHKGIDIPAPSGTPIIAANAGKVIIAFTNDKKGYSYGKYVVIDHGGGKTTLYGHCSRLNVSVGQQVQQGQVIAYVGTTGQSTGNHCHFEVRINGQHTNPMNYLKK